MAESAGFYTSRFGSDSANDGWEHEVIEVEPLDGRECVSVARRFWRFHEIIHSRWTVGPCDASRRSDALRSRNEWPTHVHSTFELAGHEVHVDHMTDRHGGPLTGLCEYQIHVDGHHAGKGGLWAMPPAGIYRNWPLAVRVGSSLLIIREFGPKLDEFAGMSLWKAVRPSAMKRRVYRFGARGELSRKKLRARLATRFPKRLLAADVADARQFSKIVEELADHLDGLVVDDRALRKVVENWVFGRNSYFKGGGKTTWSISDLETWRARIADRIVEIIR